MAIDIRLIAAGVLAVLLAIALIGAPIVNNLSQQPKQKGTK